MKKLLLCSLCICLSAFGKSSDWKLTEIAGLNNSKVGYIYHTNAIGTQYGNKTEKFVTSLRLVCSINSNEEPAIVIFWNTMTGNLPQLIEIKIDGKLIDQTPWNHEGPIFYKRISESRNLLQSIKLGRNISLQWNDGDQKITIFNLQEFKEGLIEFNKACNTQL